MAKAFDFVDSINYGKNNLLDEGADEKDYVPYLTNRALSQFADTILYANQMNTVGVNLPKRLQYEYLLGSVRKKKRRSAWHKADAELVEKIDLVANAFGMSRAKARQVLPLLSQQQLEEIKASTEKGGF